MIFIYYLSLFITIIITIAIYYYHYFYHFLSLFVTFYHHCYHIIITIFITLLSLLFLYNHNVINSNYLQWKSNCIHPPPKPAKRITTPLRLININNINLYSYIPPIHSSKTPTTINTYLLQLNKHNPKKENIKNYLNNNHNS